MRSKIAQDACRVHSVLEGSQRFCPDFRGLCPDFMRLCPDLHQTKTLGGRLQPFTPASYTSVFWDHTLSCNPNRYNSLFTLSLQAEWDPFFEVSLAQPSLPSTFARRSLSIPFNIKQKSHSLLYALGRGLQTFLSHQHLTHYCISWIHTETYQCRILQKLSERILSRQPSVHWRPAYVERAPYKKTTNCKAKTSVLHCSGRCESTLPKLV